MLFVRNIQELFLSSKSYSVEDLLNNCFHDMRRERIIRLRRTYSLELSVSDGMKDIFYLIRVTQYVRESKRAVFDEVSIARCNEGDVE